MSEGVRGVWVPPSLFGGELGEEGVLERLGEGDAKVRVVLEHATDQVEQLALVFRVRAEVTLEKHTVKVRKTYSLICINCN